MDEIHELEKILPQLVSLKKQVDVNDFDSMNEIQELEEILPRLLSLKRQIDLNDYDGTDYTDLRKMAEMAEVFMNKAPTLSVNTYRDEVVVSGVIPNIPSPQDISVTLDGGIILRVNCTWYKNGHTGSIPAKARDFKKRIELPFPVNPGTLSATYRKGLLQISAKKAADRNLWPARVQFLD